MLKKIRPQFRKNVAAIGRPVATKVVLKNAFLCDFGQTENSCDKTTVVHSDLTRKMLICSIKLLIFG